MKKLTLLSILMATAFFMNCSTLTNVYAPKEGLHGYNHVNPFLFTSVSSSDTIPKDGIGSKKAEGCQATYIWLISYGDTSIPTIMNKSGIKTIKHISTSGTRFMLPILPFVPLYINDCLIVYGD